MLRFWIILILLALSYVLIFSFEVNLTYEFNSYYTSNKFDFLISHQSPNFNFKAQLYASNDGKYENVNALKSFYSGYYFFMQNGYTEIQLNNFYLKVGRTHYTDYIKSPYSLFISSVEIPTLGMEFKYEDDKFIFKNTWLGLIRESTIFDERGADIKAYGIKFGNLTFGYEDAAMYIKRDFDLEYFFNPIPCFFVQYTRLAGRPFPEGSNDNAMIGFFLTYEKKNIYSYAQILIDDFNANRFLHPDWYQNPDKIAWNMGFNFKKDKNSFAFHFAGATKYTFEPLNLSDAFYGYTKYPTLTYTVNNETKLIPLEENYVGYKYGENNLAFMVEYESEIFDFDLYTAGEIVISGSKSPINPWHELDNFEEGTHLLDESPIEKRFSFYYKISKKIGVFNFYSTGDLSWIFNKLEICYPDDNAKLPFLKPSNKNETIFNLIFGISLNFKF